MVCCGAGSHKGTTASSGHHFREVMCINRLLSGATVWAVLSGTQERKGLCLCISHMYWLCKDSNAKSALQSGDVLRQCAIRAPLAGAGLSGCCFNCALWQCWVFSIFNYFVISTCSDRIKRKENLEIALFQEGTEQRPLESGEGFTRLGAACPNSAELEEPQQQFPFHVQAENWLFQIPSCLHVGLHFTERLPKSFLKSWAKPLFYSRMSDFISPGRQWGFLLSKGRCLNHRLLYCLFAVTAVEKAI